MSKPGFIELPGSEPVLILYEDRSVMAIDKPPGWMLVPDAWRKTPRNLQAAITSGIAGRDFWARSRNLKFLRHVHRLDADTSGVLLFVKSSGAVETYSKLFESRKMEKTYWAVVMGLPKEEEWTCRLQLAPDPPGTGRMKVDADRGKEAVTHFKFLETRGTRSLIEARPLTGRTHQIRVHLRASGLPIVGDKLYGKDEGARPLGLRAMTLAYPDPFTKKRVEIHSPGENFLKEFGFYSAYFTLQP
jgi:23S rRNA pseudouridine1911/1915/1917 synthase